MVKKQLRRAKLEEVSKARLTRFLQERCVGLPDGFTHKDYRAPIFEPGKKGQHPRVNVTTSQRRFTTVDDKYGHGRYSLYDVRKISSLTVKTMCGATLMQAVLDDGTGTFRVTITTSQPAGKKDGLRDWWGGETLTWSNLPAIEVEEQQV
jgi:hypothetical protein